MTSEQVKRIIGKEWHQSTCVSMRIPVQVTTRNSSGIPETVIARSILINQRGARFECLSRLEQQPFEMHEELWIDVLANGKALGGIVIGADSRPNRNGNFEFSVELGDSMNLFDEPPRDWINQEFSKREYSLRFAPAQPYSGYRATDSGAEESPGGVAAGGYFMRAASSPRPASQFPGVLSFSAPNRMASAERSPERPTIQGDAWDPEFRPSTARTARQHSPDRFNPPGPSKNVHRTMEKSIAGEPAPAGQSAARESQRHDPNGLESVFAPIAERLAVVFKEAIESALQMQEKAAAERLIKEVTAQVGQTKEAALDNVRQEIAQQASFVENQVLQQCRSRTEQLLSTTLQSAFHALSDQIDEMAEKTEDRVKTIFDDLAEQLEQRSTKALVETTSRLEDQMEKSARGIQGSIVVNAIKELDEKQKDIMKQVQQQIGIATEQNLSKLPPSGVSPTDRR